MPPRGDREPGFALAVIKNHQIVGKIVSGFANRQTGEMIGPDTVFDLASITKQFTAAGILMLMEDPNVKVGGERLTVKTPLRKIFNDFPASGDDITLGHLLTHQSGLPDYFETEKKRLKPTFDIEKAFEKKASPTSWYEDFKHRRPDLEITNKKVLESLKNVGVSERKKPGVEFEYSNSGYVVLAQIIEKLSGKTYRQFMHERIFKPL